MMKRIAALILVITLALAPALQAQEALTPPVVTDQNPYAAGLETAKKAYDDAVVAYRAAAQQAYASWSHYQAYVRAYYAVWNTWTRYQWYQQAYAWAARKASFSGHVIEPGIRMPVKGATVHLMRYAAPGQFTAQVILATATTDDRGAFRIDGLSTGRYTYLVTKPGYANWRQHVDVGVTGGFANVYLERAHAVSGTVTWNNRPVAGVKVSLFRTDVVYIRAPDANAIVTTDAQGRYKIASADFATYRLIFEKANYRTETRDLKRSTDPVELNVMMTWTGPIRSNEANFDDLNRN